MADVRIEIDERKLKKVAFESDATYQLVFQKRDQSEATSAAVIVESSISTPSVT